ncbi:chemotaxis protein CheX [Photobacterium aphoticum]|uniref:Chemotaxis protein CheX n=1 Tax=Photobacterium aphoticum TaxID=754436 RepID=A0A090R2Q7_9GAMM|nr:chemotaxis protein CheX [Photobacterium aphoticum]
MDLAPQKPRLKRDHVARGDVSGLIGMIGPTTKGSMSITFDESLALEIMQRMLGERQMGSMKKSRTWSVKSPTW